MRKLITESLYVESGYISYNIWKKEYKCPYDKKITLGTKPCRDCKHHIDVNESDEDDEFLYYCLFFIFDEWSEQTSIEDDENNLIKDVDLDMNKKVDRDFLHLVMKLFTDVLNKKFRFYYTVNCKRNNQENNLENW